MENRTVGCMNIFRVTKQDNLLGTGNSCRFTTIANIYVMFVCSMYTDGHQHLNTHCVPTHAGVYKHPT